MEEKVKLSNPINYNIYFESGHINYESPICMFISAVIWRLAYIFCRFVFNKRTPEFSSRILSFIHGFVAAFMGINQCFLFDWPFEHPEWKTSYVQSFIMNMSFGYFLHDSFWIFKYDRGDKIMICHHLLCVCALIRIILKGYSGAQVTCALGSMELTNPFLQARWFLRTFNMQSAPVYYSTEITFFMVFFVIRIILGTYFLNIILRQPKNEWDFILMSLGIYVVSWIFVLQIIRYFLRKYIRNQANAHFQKA